MAYVDVNAVNALLTASPNYIEREQFYKKTFFKNSLYEAFLNKSLYDMSLGKTATVITTHGEYPSQQPVGTAVGSMGSSTGTGSSNYCTVSAVELKGGQTTRTYSLQSAAFRSEVFCLNDLQWGFEPMKQLENRTSILLDAASYWWKLWYQVQNIKNITTKVTTLASNAIDTADNTDYNFSDSSLTLPTTIVTWDHIRPLYENLARAVGDSGAVGYADAEPVFVMDVGPGIKRLLWQDNTLVRSTVDWGDAFKNFNARGITKALYGFVPNVDVDIPRYDGSGRWIPPMINGDDTVGRKGYRNPAYKTVANGGSAVYEAIIIRAKDIYDVKVRPGAPSTFAGASFSPKDYTGNLQWINNKDMVDNPLGDHGYFRFEINVAAKPIYPENGYAILTLAKD